MLAVLLLIQSSPKTIQLSALPYLNCPKFRVMKLESYLNKIFAEYLGSMLLVATVVGSGIMATDISTDVGVQLLINTFATVFVLIILISILHPISGAHFNPAVTLIEFMQKRISLSHVLLYLKAQLLGAITGTALAHLMFAQDIFTTSNRVRSGSNLFLSEIVATAGLILVINILIQQKRIIFLPYLVSLWIGSGYLFTASTSFANPAVTIARSFTDTFSGIAPASVFMFVLAQFIGAFIGLLIVRIIGYRSENV